MKMHLKGPNCLCWGRALMDNNKINSMFIDPITKTHPSLIYYLQIVTDTESGKVCSKTSSLTRPEGGLELRKKGLEGFNRNFGLN